ncbi:MAG: cyclic pyranopterin monophosphate synthase MoaC [Flavobacteriales bacterium]
MIDITHKPTTLREATATALVTVSQPATIAAVKEKRVPKGDVWRARGSRRCSASRRPTS